MACTSRGRNTRPERASNRAGGTKGSLMSKRRYITVVGVLRQPQTRWRKKAGAPFIARLTLCQERDRGDEVVNWSWTAFVVSRRPPGATGSAYLQWLWHYGVDNDICGEASGVLI